MLPDEDVTSPPPKLSKEKPATPKKSSSYHSDGGGGDEKPPVIHQRQQQHDEHNVVYQIVYPQHQSSGDTSSHPSRPLTPLQITITDENSSPTVPVSCGTASGKMHLQMFLCPGIHMPCIEVGNELLSPKQFTVRGDKERQKDWKASIRVGRSSLRTHMEASTIDFYDHSNRCSGKCQSRNYVNAPVEREEVMQSRKAKRNAEVSLLKTEIEQEMQSCGYSASKERLTKCTDDESNAEAGADKTSSSEAGKTPSSAKKARGRPRGSMNKPRPTVYAQAMRTLDVADDADTSGSALFDEFFTNEPPPPLSESTTTTSAPPPTPTILLHPHVASSPFVQSERNMSGCSNVVDIIECLQNDPLNFWSQMQNTGVISHFCDDLIVSAINLKQAAIEQPMNQSLSTMLSRTVFAMGVQTVVVHRVQSIERGVTQQRKHDQMLMEIQANVNEQQQRLHEKEQEQEHEQEKQHENVASTSSQGCGPSGDVARTNEQREEEDAYIDVVGFTQL